MLDHLFSDENVELIIDAADQKLKIPFDSKTLKMIRKVLVEKKLGIEKIGAEQISFPQGKSGISR